jgi:serine/threonine protein kinase
MTADPERIGRYRIESVLGRGAMGVIYRAHDPEIDRPVAVKLIRADLLESQDRADYLVRFRREAQAAGRCTHPNIVTIYDFATHEGNPFLAMEFVDGVNLSQARERGAVFTPADAVFVILQLLDALGAMHALGVTHRDIKPANVLLVNGNKVKVTDFGISRFDASDLTQDGSVIGTPSYMSPEQCRGDPVDARSDLFSTGVLLYELLSGERPFPGRNIAEVTQRLLFEQPPDIAERCVGVSPAMKAVVDRVLAKPPEARFATAAEMAAALRAALGDPSARGMEHTIIVPQRAVPAAASDPVTASRATATGMTGVFDRDVLGTIERKLAQYVGPIARHLVQSAISKADSVEALCATLAGNIEGSSERDAFRTAALEQLRRVPQSVSGTLVTAGLSEEELQRAQKELARYIGPVARLLVKRAAAAATSPADLWQRLSVHLERDADRQAFLALRRP